MKKNTLKVTTLLLVVLNIGGYVVATASLVPGDSVPGVDVSIEQSPSGIIVASTQTNSSGAFKFEKLAPGKYKLKYGALPGQAASSASARASNNYNNAKSNTAGVAIGTANETWNVTIEINPDDVQPGQNPGILIEIGPRGGSVKGVVTKTSPLDRRGRGVATGGRGGAFSTIQPNVENPSNSRVKGEADQRSAALMKGDVSRGTSRFSEGEKISGKLVLEKKLNFRPKNRSDVITLNSPTEIELVIIDEKTGRELSKTRPKANGDFEFPPLAFRDSDGKGCTEDPATKKCGTGSVILKARVGAGSQAGRSATGTPERTVATFKYETLPSDRFDLPVLEAVDTTLQIVRPKRRTD